MGRRKGYTRRSRARCALRKKMPAGADYIDHTRNGYRKLWNIGRGDCALIALIQLKMAFEGVSWDEIVRRTTGELGGWMREQVRSLRERIVAAVEAEPENLFDDELTYDESMTFEECLEKGIIEFGNEDIPDECMNFEGCLKFGTIKSLTLWKKVMASGGCWLDEMGVSLGAKLEGLGGRFAIVEANGAGVLHELRRTYVVQGYSSLMLYGGGHFEALYQVKKTNLCL